MVPIILTLATPGVAYSNRCMALGGVRRQFPERS